MSNLNPLWKDTEFDSIFYVEKGIKRKQIQTKDYLPFGKFPIVDQGKEKIVAYSNDVEKLYDSTPVIVFGDHTRILKYVTFPFIVGADGTQLLKVQNDFSLRFCFYLLQNTKIENLGYSRHMSLLKEKVFSVPPLAEQEKIAEILGTWDTAIEKLSALIEQKKQLKKGLMQRLLTGKQRLPGFSAPWKKVKLGDVALLFSGGTPSKEEPLYWENGHIKWLSAKYIENDKIIGWDYITDEGLEKSSAKTTQVNDIILVTRVSVGKIYFCQESYAVNQDLTVIRAKNISSNFLFFLIKNKQNLIIDKSQGLAIKGITKEELSNISFLLPPLPEQKAIADILSKADEEITLLIRKLSALKTQKTGLMQKLLTGQIRVKAA